MSLHLSLSMNLNRHWRCGQIDDLALYQRFQHVMVQFNTMEVTKIHMVYYIRAPILWPMAEAYTR